MQKDSYVLMLLIWLKSAFLNSAIYRAVICITNKISYLYSKSKIKQLLCGKGDMEDMYASESQFYKIMGLVVSPFTSAVKYLKKAAKESVFLKFFENACKKSIIFDNVFDVPFICFLIFIIPHNMWNNIYALAAAVIMLLLALWKSADNKNLPKVWFVLLLFIFSTAVACITSYGRSDSVRVFIFVISAVLMCVAVYVYISDKKHLEKFIKWMFAAVIVTAVIAFVQRAMGIDADELLADMELNAGMPGRAFSTFGNPNNYAEFLMLFLPFAFAYAFTRKNVKARICLMVGVAVAVGALVLTYSRSGWIAFALAVVVYVMLSNKKLLPFLAVLAIVAIPFLPQSVLNRILTIGNMKDTSSAYRINIWTGCINMIKDYWTTGVGLGSAGFMNIYPKYSVVDSHTAPHSHMQFMEMLIELGIVGFVIYVCFTFVILRRFFKNSHCEDVLVRNVITAAAAAMAGIILIGFFEYCWFYPRVMFAFFVCVGVGMAAVNLAKKGKTSEK